MLYYIGRNLLTPLVYLLFWPKVTGKENLPKEGSTIIFANHTSGFDPIILGCLLPRKIYFCQTELFKFAPFGALLRLLGAIPVKRESADITAIKTALRVLRAGKVLEFFRREQEARAAAYRTSHMVRQL